MIERLVDILKQPRLRYRLWKTRKLRLRAVRDEWSQRLENTRVSAWLDVYGSQREIRDWHMFHQKPRRYRG